MKTLQRLMERAPSYCTWGNERLADRTGLKVNTIARFKKTDTYKDINKNYRNSL